MDAMNAPDSLPMRPTSCDGGYFLVVDIRECRDMVPEKYLASHDYLEGGPVAHKVTLPNGRVPLDLAFCRWMACEKNLAIMPNCFFYGSDSPNIEENYVRMALCKEFGSLKAGASQFKA